MSFESLRLQLLQHLIDQKRIPSLHQQQPVNGDDHLNTNNINIAHLLFIEVQREQAIHKLATEMASILSKYSPASNEKRYHNEPERCYRAVKQLLPQWFVTFINFEWKRTATDDDAPFLNKELESGRSWVCPLLDAGREVIIKRDESTKNNDNDNTLWTVADKLPSKDSLVVLQNNKNNNPQEFPLNQVSLSQPIQEFCRDPLIPSLEDEPAARCGSATLFSKFMFDFGINVKDGTMNKVMRQVGHAASRIRYELFCTQLQQQQSEPASLETKLVQCTDQIVEFSVLIAGGGSEFKSFSITPFQFVKLFILFVRTRNNNNDNKLLINALKTIQASLSAAFPLPVIASALFGTLSRSVSVNNDKNREQHNNDTRSANIFFYSIARCIQRYRNFDGGDDGTLGNLHAAIHPAFAISLKADVELFANPFNTSSIHFCSLFGETEHDTDRVFGSLGRCWDLLHRNQNQNQEKLLLEANPPFDPSVVQRLAMTISRIKNKNKIVIIVPEPMKEIKHGDKNSKYGPAVAMLKDKVKCGCISSNVIPARQAPYIRGLQQQQQQHSQGSDLICIQRDTAIIVCGDEDDEDFLSSRMYPSVEKWTAEASALIVRDEAGVIRVRGE